MKNKEYALLGKGQDDWHAGANSPIKRTVLELTSNWKDVRHEHELQIANIGTSNSYDTSMCVTYNGLEDPIALILSKMIQLNLIPTEHVTWLNLNGYFKDGMLDFSERFNAVKGETDKYGAYQFKVANAAKNCGLIPGSMFKSADNFEDNINPKFVTAEMDNLGLEFAKRFYINYEWVNDSDTKEFLKYSPLSCIGEYADGEGILKPKTNRGHCMMLVNETNDYREIDDSYSRRYKKYNKESLQSFMAYYITPLTVNMDIVKFLKDNNNKILRNSNTGAYGVVYNNTPMLIVPERAGVFMIDRDSRNLIGKAKKVELSDSEWNQLTWVKF